MLITTCQILQAGSDMGASNSTSHLHVTCWLAAACARGLSQMYRTPGTTHLVTALKDKVRELTDAKQQVQDELDTLKNSLR